MRQAGLLAAAGLHALQHHRSGLVVDHIKAKRLANGLSAMKCVSLDPASVETNIVMIDIVDGRSAADVLLQLESAGVRMVLLTRPVEDATVPSSTAKLPMKTSSSTSMLPQISRSTARAAGEFPLGLSPADRSLLPMQQKQRRAKAVSCQTDVLELADLRELQQQLFDVRQELSTVNAELSHAERRLRHEVREEMEERMHKFERRTKEKVSFLKQRQESSVTVMRKASKAQLESAKAAHEHSLRVEAEAKEHQLMLSHLP